MITPSFSPTATERVLPKLALDFTTASLDPRVTFTRTTDATHPATYVNSSGYITSATDNQPRFDYSPTALTCKGLLIEESRTNSSTNSDQFNLWTKSGGNVSSDSVQSPDGTTNADTFTCTAGNAFHYLENVTALNTTSAQTASVYLKAGTSNFASLVISGSNNTRWLVVTVNLSTGVITQSSNGINATLTGTSITPAGNGWYRVSVSGTFTALDPSILWVQINSTGTPTYGIFGLETWTAAGTETIYTWGAQLEAGAFATSYIPTTSAALTRNADVATMTGTNFSDWYVSSNCSIESEWTLPSVNTTAQNAWQFTLDGNNRFLCQANNSGGSTRHLLFSGGSAVLALDISGVQATTNKNAVTLVSGSNKASRNASVPVSNVYSGSYVSCTSLSLGSANGSGFLNGWLKKFNFYTIPMITNEVRSISKV